MLGNVKGKVTIITGSASGIGMAMAYKFAEAGSVIVIADLNLDAAILVANDIKNMHNVETFALTMDVTNEKQVNDGVAAVVAKFGRVDCLILRTTQTFI